MPATDARTVDCEVRVSAVIRTTGGSCIGTLTGAKGSGGPSADTGTGVIGACIEVNINNGAGVGAGCEDAAKGGAEVGAEHGARVNDGAGGRGVGTMVPKAGTQQMVEQKWQRPQKTSQSGDPGFLPVLGERPRGSRRATESDRSWTLTPKSLTLKTMEEPILGASNIESSGSSNIFVNQNYIYVRAGLHYREIDAAAIDAAGIDLAGLVKSALQSIPVIQLSKKSRPASVSH
ncbi:hypothetical protein UY3_03905 [Chelonia mydas]|uniref:Uncharacterized protein n=1 Tax=Chelonia mydas TaxID=8469 RepID=M7BSZ8_CHEMY|nr:hypothetical protein UY3_03905 [Chelonia mydas]